MASRAAVYEAISDRLQLSGHYNVAAPGQPPLWVAGLDVERAAIVDIYPVADPDRWLLNPAADWTPALAQAAQVGLDALIQRYRVVLDDRDTPMEQLHLYTNHPVVVDALASALVRNEIAARSRIVMVDLNA